MIRVEEASLKDFDQVYPLLRQLNDTTISKDTWRLSFESPFQKEAPAGYLLKDDDKIVGFFGTIFSERYIDGKKMSFCNCHSWFVDEKYRSKGLLLLAKVHKLKVDVLTVFSASKETFGIYKQLKWTEIDNTHSIFRRNLFSFTSKRENAVLKGKSIEAKLTDEEESIAMHHTNYRCTHNYLKTEAGGSLQIFRSLDYSPSRLALILQKIPLKMKLGQLYYASNPDVLFSDFARNVDSICRKEQWIGLVIPNRMLKKSGIPYGKKYFGSRPMLVRSEQSIADERLDMLYSEVFLLDLA